MITSTVRLLFVSTLVLYAASAQAAALPVREVTVFKDGHAFLLREGSMPTNADGDVVLDELPIPELGTFFPYSADKAVPLTSVVASRDSVDGSRPAQSIPDLIDANKGQQVDITTTAGDKVDGAIVDVPSSPAPATDSDQVVPTTPPDLVIVKTAAGVQALRESDIRSLVFPGDFHGSLPNPGTRARLKMTLNWHGKPRSTADVGMMYLEGGLRWLPSYKITLDGAGTAHVLLQATLSNDLIDLDDVTANLVIGVPTFDFAGTPDPIALQDTLGQVASMAGRDTRLSNAYSNTYMTQVSGTIDHTYAIQGDNSLIIHPTPEVSGSEKAEDMFVFTVHHVTLKVGQAMVVPVMEFDLKYADVYTLDLPAMPPTDTLQYLDYNTQQSLKTAVETAKVLHKIRLTDSAGVPLTTAPAMILSNGRVISQSTMLYTATGGRSDLTVAPAVNVQPSRKDVETKNVPNAMQWAGNDYARVDYEGNIDVDNYEPKAIDLEVTRHVIGRVDGADENGTFEELSALDADGYSVSSSNAEWWDHLNGYGKVFWKVHVDPNQCAHLKYEFHYFYR